MFSFQEISKCRSCGLEALVSALNLGNHYISDFIEQDERPSLRVPLELVLCHPKRKGCGLLQLKHTVSPEWLYQNYWYHSGMNQTMCEALADIACQAQRRIPLQEGDVILDIGCNDGTLLRSYSIPGLLRVGFEPSSNIAPLAKEGGNIIVNDFFNWEAFQRAFPKRKAKGITAIAMFYDLDDPNTFVADVAQCLDTCGVWIIQMSYLPLMLKQNAFDNICHEHLEYYSLKALRSLLARHHLEIQDVELNDVNGGSFRIYVGHPQSSSKPREEGASARIKELEALEREMQLEDLKTYQAFSKRVLAIKGKLCRFINAESSKGKKIYVYGASTKGNTLLQFLGLDEKRIAGALEKNQDKWGRRTIGTNIPILSENEGHKEEADYFLILPWHFLKEFEHREKDFLNRGGKFIVPLPEVKIMGREDL